MKRFLNHALHTAAGACCLALLLISCNYKEEMTELNDEVHRLQALVTEINESTENLLRLIEASREENDWVTSVETVYDGGVETGTMIHFLHRESIFISNGKTGPKGDTGRDGADGKDASAPVISIRKDNDGIWYWTMNGTWLLNDVGERVVARGTDGTPPTIKAESGKWWVSYDEGRHWSAVGNIEGESWSTGTNYAQVTNVGDSSCEITLRNGQKLYLPMWVEFDVTFPYGTTYYLEAGKSISVTAMVAPSCETDITSVCDEGLSAEIKDKAESAQFVRIRIQASNVFKGGNISLVFGKGGKLVCKQLTMKPLDYSDKSVEQVILSSSRLELALGCTAYLSASVKPENPNYHNIIWNSDNPAVATVSNYGTVTAISAGTCNITATAHNGKRASCEVLVGSQRAVDLGLSVNWSECNIGASSPFEEGDFFAWGETKSKTGEKSTGYSWANYSLCNGAPDKLLRYNTKSSFGIVDNVKVLRASDDAASAQWGGDWRMPTAEEWAELYDNCTWEWLTDGKASKHVPSFTAQNNGYLVIKGGTGAERLDTGSYIFLPAGGFYSGSYVEDGSVCHYWSSSLFEDNPDRSLEFVAGASNIRPQYGSSRCFGLSIRPVVP